MFILPRRRTKLYLLGAECRLWGGGVVIFNRRVMGELICDIMNNDFTYTFFTPERDEFWGQVYDENGYALKGQERKKRLDNFNCKLMGNFLFNKNRDRALGELKDLRTNLFTTLIESVFYTDNLNSNLPVSERFYYYLDSVFPSFSFKVEYKYPVTTSQDEIEFETAYNVFKKACTNKSGAFSDLCHMYSSIKDAVYECVYLMAETSTTIKKCENCGRFFVPKNRSDTIYCDYPSPQDNKKTCKKYGAEKKYQKNLKDNELMSLYRRIYMSKQMLAKRHPDISAYTDAFNKYKEESKKWKADIKSGTKTEDEYLLWLREVKEKKVF